jgi:hypothetical protein
MSTFSFFLSAFSLLSAFLSTIGNLSDNAARCESQPEPFLAAAR